VRDTDILTGRQVATVRATLRILVVGASGEGKLLNRGGVRQRLDVYAQRVKEIRIYSHGFVTHATSCFYAALRFNSFPLRSRLRQNPQGRPDGRGPVCL